MLVLALILLGIVSGSGAGATAGFPTLELVLEGEKFVSARLGTKQYTVAELQGSPQTFDVGATLAFTPQTGLQVRSGAQGIWVKMANLPNLRLRLTPQADVSFRLLPSMLEVISASQGSAVHAEFPDGASATVHAASRLRYDHFLDGTYSVLGAGTVSAQNADGKILTLSAELPPMTGGPLTRVAGSDGIPRLHRSAPGRTVKIIGELAGEVIVSDGEQLVPVTPKGNHLTFAHGARLKVSHAADRSLTWEVDKGIFTISLADIPGWKVMGWTAQKARLTWDKASDAVDLQNLSADSGLLVSLPGHAYSYVEPGVTFQFVRLGPAIFAASVVSGEASIVNSVTGHRFSVTNQRLLLQAGEELGHVSTRKPTQVFLTTLSPRSLTAAAGAQSVTVMQGDNLLLETETTQQLRVHWTQGDQLSLAAETGDFEISYDAIPGAVMQLPQGTQFAFKADSVVGLLEGTAAAANVEAVWVRGPKVSVKVEPGKEMMLLIPSTASASRLAGMVYSERLEPAGSAAALAPFEEAPGFEPSAFRAARDPRGVFRARILQPPVSVAGHNSD